MFPFPPSHPLTHSIPEFPPSPGEGGGRRTLRRRSSPLARSLIVSQGLMSIGWTRRVRRAVVYSEVHHPAEPRRLSGGKCITLVSPPFPSCVLPQFPAVRSPVVRLYFDAPRLHSAFQFVQMGTRELPTNRPDRTRGRGRCEAKWSPPATQSFSQPAVGLLYPVSVNEIGP